MRNDSLDELDELPSLKTDMRAEAVVPHPAHHPVAPGLGARAGVPLALWMLLGLALLALAALAWWSQQRLEQMAQQLVATQDSFARISEDAAGRLKEVSGKVVATESSVTSEAETLKLRIKQLESRLAQLEQQRQDVVEQAEAQGRQLEQLHGELRAQQDAAGQLSDTLKEQQGALSTLDSRVKGLGDQQAALQAAQGEQAKLNGRVEALAGELAALKKQGDPRQAIARLEDDLLVLRSQLDNLPAGGTAELDAFRLQTTRNITTLQTQVRNLQQHLNAR